MKNNIVIVTSNDTLKLAKEANIMAFLFPLKEYSVGFKKTFRIDEIHINNSYLYINATLTNDDISSLKHLLNNLNDNIKGIFFEDLGLLEVLKDTKLEKILMNYHVSTNYKSINYFLDYFDDVVLSTDITKKEMEEILKKSKKKLSIYEFGKLPLMYSRRLLLTNFANYYNLPINTEKTIYEKINNESFSVLENELGTIIYSKKFYFNDLYNEKINFYIINPLGLSEEEEKVLFTNLKNDKNILTDINIPLFNRFLNEETIYKLPAKDVI